jgi:hypothetical protein
MTNPRELYGKILALSINDVLAKQVRYTKVVSIMHHIVIHELKAQVFLCYLLLF